MKKFTACLLLLLCVAAAVATAQYAPRGCMPMRDMTSISFEPGMTQNRRRNPNTPRMNCVGNCPGDAYLAGAQCKQEGLSDNGLPSWHCIGNFERDGDRYTLGNVKVSCEGCEYSGDPNVVLGSCALTYAVKSKNSNSNRQQQPSHTTTTTTTSSHGGYYSSSDDSTNAIFAFIFIIIVLVIVLSVCCSSSNNVQRDANYRQGYAYGQAPPPPPGPGPYSNNGYAAAQNYQSGFVDGATTASVFGGGYGRRAYYDPPVHHTTHTTTTHYSGGDNSSSGNSGGGSSNSDNGGGRGGSESL